MTTASPVLRLPKHIAAFAADPSEIGRRFVLEHNRADYRRSFDAFRAALPDTSTCCSNSAASRRKDSG